MKSGLCPDKFYKKRSQEKYFSHRRIFSGFPARLNAPPIAQRMFELYAIGEDLAVLRFEKLTQAGKRVHSEFAFSGLLRCAYDKCAVTAEFKKQPWTR